MKAIVYRNYGSPDVLSYEELEKPTPGDNEVLIRVRAASINPYDRHFLKGKPRIIRFMQRKQKIKRPGVDLAGTVEAVGKAVTQLKPGDEVFGSARGAFAEYVCASESAVAPKPGNMTFEQAAAVPMAAFTALQALRDKGQLQSGQKVLINGAGGGIGTFAVQIAKAFGAHVTGVCSTRNADMVRSIGADRVIDYTREDFTKLWQRYDLILDTAGNHSLSACRSVLNPAGKLLLVGGPISGVVVFLGRLLKAALLSRFASRRKPIIVMAKARRQDLIVMRELMESGKVTPVIDRVFGLSDVPAAFRYSQAEHARGKVVISLE